MKHRPTAAHTPHPDVEIGKPVRSVKKSGGTAEPQTASSGQTRDEMIHQTAYFLYEARSCTGGQELDDWLQAEAQFSHMSPQSSGTGESPAQTA